MIRMRLSDEEKTAIKRAVQEHFGPDARVYLFGSRADDRARGGDIDLYVESGLEGEALVEAKLKAISRIQFRIGERKIDIVAASETAEDDERPVVQKGQRNRGQALMDEVRRRIESALKKNDTHLRRLDRAKRLLAEFFPLTEDTFQSLTEEQIEHMDQFVYRFTKLQDSMGTRLCRLSMPGSKPNPDPCPFWIF